jgi:L-iditol 2-dehydrogenase
VAERREKAQIFGARSTIVPEEDLPARLEAIAPPYGPDAVCAATDSERAVEAALQAVRFGGTVILFGHTRLGHGLTIDAGQIGVAEKRLVGSYSSSIELNDEVTAALLDEEIPWHELVTHVVPLEEINSALALARRPEAGSLKTAVAPSAEERAGDGNGGRRS